MCAFLLGLKNCMVNIKSYEVMFYSCFILKAGNTEMVIVSVLWLLTV